MFGHGQNKAMHSFFITTKMELDAKAYCTLFLKVIRLLEGSYHKDK